MISRNQMKQFTMTVIDLHRDNFIELIHNPEFQSNDVELRERAIRYMTALFKQEIEEHFDSFIKTNPN